MRRKIALALVVGLLACSAPALAADGEGRISGRLVEIRSDGKLVIEEQGPWKGPGTGLITRTVDLAPGTSIRVVRPTGKWDPNDATPGYEIEAADFRALKPGDFVTVTTAGRAAAVSIDVMRTDSDTGLASPRTESLGGK
jgi:hypothetical protein